MAKSGQPLLTFFTPCHFFISYILCHYISVAKFKSPFSFTIIVIQKCFFKTNVIVTVVTKNV